MTKQDFEALARSPVRDPALPAVQQGDCGAQQDDSAAVRVVACSEGFPCRNWAVVTELAHGLQLRHHSVVELINQAQVQGLLRRAPDPDDDRAVRVSLTGTGERDLARPSALHRYELRPMRPPLAIPDLGGSDGEYTVLATSRSADPRQRVIMTSRCCGAARLIGQS